MTTHLRGKVLLDHPIEEVFEFVADARNDPSWCPRVRWCRQTEGKGPHVGARYEALHKPSGYPVAHLRHIEVLEFEPSHFVRWRQNDQIGTFLISYSLEAVGERTSLVQEDDIFWRRLPLVGLVGRRVVGRHIGEQHADLQRVLEQSLPRT
jgi:uncharacterized protein YndB with AHSA1/START domain